MLVNDLIAILDCDNGCADVINHKIIVNFSDIFYYACADGEKIELDEVPYIASVLREHGFNGVIAWAIKERGRSLPFPQKKNYDFFGKHWKLHKDIRAYNAWEARRI